MSNFDFESVLTQYGLKIVSAIAVLIIGKIVAKLMTSLSSKILHKKKIDETVVSFVGNIIYFCVIIITIIAVLNQLGVATTSLVAVLGAAGLAIGLALQGSLSNFAAGFLIIILKPFKAGDFVEGASTTGIVEEVGIFTIKLRTPDNKEVIIPNGKMIGDNIINYSSREKRRIDIVVGVSYDDDIKKVKNVLNSIVERNEKLLKDPKPLIGIVAFADSSINFNFRVWCKTGDYWDLYYQLMEEIKEEFDKNFITIPFPQRDVHLHNPK